MSIDTHVIDGYVQTIMHDDTLPATTRAQHAAVAIRNTVLTEARLPYDTVLEVTEEQMAAAFERITETDWLDALAESNAVEETNVVVFSESYNDPTAVIPIIDLDQFEADLRADLDRLMSEGGA